MHPGEIAPFLLLSFVFSVGRLWLFRLLFISRLPRFFVLLMARAIRALMPHAFLPDHLSQRSRYSMIIVFGAAFVGEAYTILSSQKVRESIPSHFQPPKMISVKQIGANSARGGSSVADLPVIENFSDTSLLTANMYVLQDTKPLQRCTESSGDVSARTGRDISFGESEYVEDEILDFVHDYGSPVSSTEYACWHALVRHQLSSLRTSPDGPSARQLDFKLAIDCFEAIEKVHRCLTGNASEELTDPQALQKIKDTSSGSCNVWHSIFLRGWLKMFWDIRPCGGKLSLMRNACNLVLSWRWASRLPSLLGSSPGTPTRLKSGVCRFNAYLN